MKSLSVEEMNRLLDVAREHSERNYLALLIGYSHGLRVSEIAALRVRDVCTGFLDVKRLKGSMRTVQPLTDAEKPALEAFCNGLKPQDRLFPLSRVTLHRMFKHYCELAAIPAIPGRGIHSLKHSIAMHSIHTAGIENVRIYLGHKSLASTGAYLKPSDQQASQAVQGAIAS